MYQVGGYNSVQHVVGSSLVCSDWKLSRIEVVAWRIGGTFGVCQAHRPLCTNAPLYNFTICRFPRRRQPHLKSTMKIRGRMRQFCPYFYCNAHSHYIGLGFARQSTTSLSTPNRSKYSLVCLSSSLIALDSLSMLRIPSSFRSIVVLNAAVGWKT